MLASRRDTCDADEGRSRFIGLEAIKNECVPPRNALAFIMRLS